jgi:transposase
MEKKRGRKGPGKLTEKLCEYIRQLRKQVPGISGAKIAQRVEEEFGIKLHKRTVEKALKKIHLKRKSMDGERG